VIAENVNHVWHFWLAVPLAAAAVLLVLGLVGLYFFTVSRTRFPKR
jgi:hypothetical protein